MQTCSEGEKVAKVKNNNNGGSGGGVGCLDFDYVVIHDKVTQ